MMKYQNVFKSPFEGDGYGDLSVDVWKVVYGTFEESDYQPNTIYVIACSLSDAIGAAESLLSEEFYDDGAIVSVERFFAFLIAAPNIELKPNA